jgi:putative oxidoreductase
MKRIFSVTYYDTSLDIALLILRVGASVFMIHHGYTKMTHFAEMQEKFINFLGFSGSVSLCLTIFAELFCSIVLLFGFLSRVVAIPLLFTMLVAVFVGHHGDIFGDGEHAALYILIYAAILIAGPGGYSLDGWISKTLSK